MRRGKAGNHPAMRYSNKPSLPVGWQLKGKLFLNELDLAVRPSAANPSLSHRFDKEPTAQDHFFCKKKPNKPQTNFAEIKPWQYEDLGHKLCLVQKYKVQQPWWNQAGLEWITAKPCKNLYAYRFEFHDGRKAGYKRNEVRTCPPLDKQLSLLFTICIVPLKSVALYSTNNTRQGPDHFRFDRGKQRRKESRVEVRGRGEEYEIE